MSGQAASYYNDGFAQPQPQQPSQGYNNGNYGNYNPNYQPNQPTYQQPEVKPPQYQQNVPQSGYSFDQAFKIEKPKWNDLWAGLLVSLRRDTINTHSRANAYHS
jgi:hypothetical protein